ncbi:MAG: flagellar biosynthetic protein FliO [Armatimonadota bacterium]|nr:flagellar biosynthetic protein FliO [Armatimonadota bacterium]MDR5704412.1 flagellar biosynthetic protein FliO [Armatimonadota bacterium]
MRPVVAPALPRFPAWAVVLLVLFLLLPSPKLGAAQRVPVYTEPKATTPDYGDTLVRLLVSLALVVLLILFLTKGLRLLAARGLAPQRGVKILEVQRLSPAHLVYLVEVGGRVLLLGGGQGGLALLAELEPEEVAMLREERPKASFASALPLPQDPWVATVERLQRIRGSKR